LNNSLLTTEISQPVKKMKNSDKKNHLKQVLQKGSKRFALSTIVLIVFTTFAGAQDFTFIEGSVHSFNVEYHDGNTFAWSFHDEAFNELDETYIDFIEGQNDVSVTVQFLDINRSISQYVYLAVVETNQQGCSTSRAISIDLQPNNMYLEFASAETQDCFNMGEFYAPLKVGLNFLNNGASAEIPESRFPLQVSYEIRNVTDGLVAEVGNSGAPLTLEYSDLNDYYLLVTEAVGEPNRTVEYELAITSVSDKYQTLINNNDGDIRLQIRVINHLPQSGSMDMALAYVVTPINYLGAL
jgi:hypothetical protein